MMTESAVLDHWVKYSTLAAEQVAVCSKIKI